MYYRHETKQTFNSDVILACHLSVIDGADQHGSSSDRWEQQAV